MSGKTKIVIFLGSTRVGRMGERVASFVQKTVENNGMEPVLMDPSTIPFEVLKMPMHFMQNPEKDAPAWMKDVNKTIVSADGYVIVSPEYNCAIPPALTNMMDHFSPASYRHKPCGIVTYSPGELGGARVSALIRPFASELGMVTIPTYALVPQCGEAIDEKGNCKADRVKTNIDKLVKEVGWYSKALKTFKSSTAPPS